MRELIFLLEERSAKAMLESLLPRILNEAIQFRCIPFEGKQDLEKQLVRKIRAYQNNQARFIVMRDQDGHPDCLAVKRRLLDLCNEAGKADKCLVRIACMELETFYLADLQAVEQALQLQGLVTQQQTRKFRAPDLLGSPSKELNTLTKQCYEKIAGSRAIGQHLKLDNERSPSFRNLIAAIRRMENELISEKA
jgi:LmbE family N-acetylglucosaminyl deacetylase